MKEAIISFLMSAVVATGIGWVKDKMAFPVTAVEKLKGIAQEADTQGLAMKVLGGDMDHSLLVSLPKCIAENKSAEPCVAQGVDLLKSSLAKRAETAKAAITTQGAAKELTTLIEQAPFSDSVKPLLAPLTDRLKTAEATIGQAQSSLDGGMASIAGKLLALKGGSSPQMAELLSAMKSAGLEKALEQAKIVLPAPAK
jgi:hypothetical protein